MPDDRGETQSTRPAAIASPAELAALVDGSAVSVVERDVVTVDGPDSATYLQGQLSQDVVALPVGADALTFLLEPQGRLVAVARVHRASDDRFVLDVEPGIGAAVVTRLNRFKLRTKASISLESGVVHLAYRGPEGSVPQEARRVVLPGLSGWDLPGNPDPPAGSALVGTDPLEALRVAAGIPAACDLDDRTVPAETGLVEAAASFTKGCYTGQELVARMDSRAALPPRRIRRISGAGGPPAVGSSVETPDGRAAGRLSTVVGTGAEWTALALVPRAVEGGPVSVDDGELRVAATVEA